MNPISIFEKHHEWPKTLKLIQTLTQNGHKALLAGGCVRDALLGIIPHDFDVATSATPEQVLHTFPQGITVGAQFGVIIVPYDGFQIEVATFRKDGLYVDGRRPEAITFSTPQEDAARRDFTINGLFYDLSSNQVLDYVGGIQDLEKRIIRAIGDAHARLSEDKLRILRAVRFSAQLGFAIESNTEFAMTQLSPQISVVAKERITQEFRKLIAAQDSYSGLMLAHKTKILNAIFGDNDIFLKEHWQKYLLSAKDILITHSIELWLTHFLIISAHLRHIQIETRHKIDWDILPFIFSHEMKRTVEYLMRGFAEFQNKSDDALLMLDHDLGPLLTELCYALAKAEVLSSNQISSVIEHFLLLSDQDGHLPKPYLVAADLIALGVKEGAIFGQLLKECYRAQIHGTIKSKTEALAWVREKL